MGLGQGRASTDKEELPGQESQEEETQGVAMGKKSRSGMKHRKKEPLSPTGSSPWKRGAVRGASSKVSALIELAASLPEQVTR
jgi:hypothetical protein